MTPDEAIAALDHWARLLDVSELREAAGVIGAEVERLTDLATCGCGDVFTAADPARCGVCVSTKLAAKDAEIERLRAEAAWVPVSERLPEIGETVLIHLPGHARGEVREAWRAIPYEGATTWYWRNGRYEVLAFSGDAPHWRPLPDPPQGGQEAPR